MKRLVTLFFVLAVLAFGANGVYSDMTVSQQGVGFRASVTVFVGNTSSTVKAQLYRDKAGIMGLANPFQSGTNGRFTFFVANGWYDIMVSGTGVTNYTYSVFVTDGTFQVGGQATGDLRGQYPSPSVAGINGKPLSTLALQDQVVPSYSASLGLWQWKIPIYSFPQTTSNNNISGTYPSIKVTGFWDRMINNATPPNEGDTIRYRSAPGKWTYEAMATSPTTMTFNLCTTQCVVQNVAAPAYIATSSISIQKCYITAGSVPQGGNLVVDVVKVGGGSIYASGLSNKLNLTATGGVALATPPTPGIGNAGDAFVVNILQVGSIFAGQNVTVACQIVGN